MADPHALSMIRSVGTVFVPVIDQNRALSFYTEILRFEKRMDFEYGPGLRWIEVSPPGSNHRIALVSNSEGTARPGLHTYCALEVQDADDSHAALKSRGADVSIIGGPGTQRTGLFGNIVVKNPVPRQFYVHDPDRNRFLVVQVAT